MAIRRRIEGITVSRISTDVSIQLSPAITTSHVRDGFHMVCKVCIETERFFISRSAVKGMTGYDMNDRVAGETNRERQ